MTLGKMMVRIIEIALFIPKGGKHYPTSDTTEFNPDPAWERIEREANKRPQEASGGAEIAIALIVLLVGGLGYFAATANAQSTRLQTTTTEQRVAAQEELSKEFVAIRASSFDPTREIIKQPPPKNTVKVVIANPYGIQSTNEFNRMGDTCLINGASRKFYRLSEPRSGGELLLLYEGTQGVGGECATGTMFWYNPTNEEAAK